MDLLSLNATHPDRRHLSLQRVASVVLHGLVLGVLAYQVRVVARVRPRKMVAVKLIPYAPGHVAIAQPRRPKVIPPKVEPRLALKIPDPPPPSSAGDPTGEADVSVAMADFYPQPAPDLSALPHGTRGDVVITIVVDEDGKVVETHVDQGLGHGVDEAVLAVVQTWTFTPATKAGKPVASEQQLLFHFERA